MRQVDARRDDVAESDAATREHGDEVGDDAMGLSLDAFGVRLVDRCARKRHLTRQKEPAVGFDGVAERGDRVRRAGDHVKRGCHGDLSDMSEAALGLRS